MSDVNVKSKKFIYKNFLKWQTQRKGLLSHSGKPYIEVATPPEFKGHPGIWSPEDLFVASVNSCIMTTFLYYAEKEGIEFLGYESQAEGILERVNRQFAFSEIKIRPLVFVKQDTDIQRAKDLLERSEKTCLISNSIKAKVGVFPEIKVGI
ncbi:hypothetical protein ES702_06060 [subsurface metagenome]